MFSPASIMQLSIPPPKLIKKINKLKEGHATSLMFISVINQLDAHFF